MAKVNEKSKLTAKQLLVLQSEMVLRKRSTWIAYLIFLVLPIAFIGGHHWYLRNYGRAVAYPLFGFLMLAFVSSDSPAATRFLGLYFGLIALDFCTLAFQVGRSNCRIERKIIRSLPSAEATDASSRVAS